MNITEDKIKNITKYLNKTNSDIVDDNDDRCDYEIFDNILKATLPLSIVCLTLIIFVCCSLPEFKTVNGKILINLSVCLAISYASSFLGIFVVSYIRHFDFMKTCIILGIISRTMCIATYFWTNVMTFDICRAICRKTPKSQLGKRRYTIYYYSLYAWTGTLITSGIIIYIQSIQSVQNHIDMLDFDLGDCTFDTVMASLYYVVGIIGILLLSNLVMLILTIATLVKIQKETKILEENQNKYILLYVKLFFIMGVIWMTGLASFFNTLCALHMCTEVLNTLHGIFLFAVFICKKSVFLKVRDRWCKKCVKNNNKS